MSERGNGKDWGMDVTFYFDPGCPWTWLSSRWLVNVSEAEGFDITWRSFSLPYTNRDNEIPEEHRALLAAGTAAHRVIQMLLKDDDNDAVGRFYEALGTRIHSAGEDTTVDLVREVLSDLGLDDVTDDESLDGPAAESTEEALCLAGPDIGSPVLSLGEEQFSLFGPIIDAVPDDEESLRLWQAVQLLATIPQYHELKRGRREAPAVRSLP
jgi:hypothetical protein